MPLSPSPTPLTDTERRNWWRLSRTEGVGPITFFRLIERYGSATRAIDALPDLSKRGGRKIAIASFDATRADDEIAAITKNHARMIAACEPDYPEMLRNIDDAPPFLVIKGNPQLWRNKVMVGMVGARNASLPGRKMAYTLARDLGTHGYIVASGLARGIDTAAHEGSIKTGTVAVVAGGVDVIYPPENQKLYDEICTTGVVISEHPCGTEPKAPYFPRRNRIISGISAGTVVVEATTNSGSLVTARCALEQGRDVFAVPGSPMDPRAGGPNQLIRDGAMLVERAEHIISGLSTPHRQQVLCDIQKNNYDSPPLNFDDPQIDAARTKITEYLSYTPTRIDEIARACHLNIQLVQIAVLELELGDQVERLPGNRITLINKDFLLDISRACDR